MILVTVGTHSTGFERLVKKIDEISFKLETEIIIQIGSTNYKPKNVKWFEFIEYGEMTKLISKSDLIICHGGAGTLLDIYKFNKRIIVVPRLKKFKEAFDDHERELAKALKDKMNVDIVLNVTDLEEKIRENNLQNTNCKKNRGLHRFLKDYLKMVE